jgi:hypothetical protein
MTEIRSYRTVFDLERRIYRVDRLRLNPGGVPLRGVVYFLAILVGSLLVGRLPLLGALAQTLPWYVRELLFPGAVAALLTMIKIEGRSFHLSALALLQYATGPRELAGLRPLTAADRRWHIHELVLLADGSDSRLRRLRYTGPGAVLVRAAHVRTIWRPGPLGTLARRPSVMLTELANRPSPTSGQVIALADGARLEVRGRRGISDGSAALLWRRQRPPAMPCVPPARLRPRAASGIPRPSTPSPPPVSGRPRR